MFLTTFRVDKVLDFGHEEFAHAQKTGTRGDFVTEGFAYRSGGERHSLLVELEEFLEIEELALGGFWAKVALGIAAGANGGLEHEVEGDGWVEVTAGGGILDVVLNDELTQLVTVIIVNLWHWASV